MLLLLFTVVIAVVVLCFLNACYVMLFLCVCRRSAVYVTVLLSSKYFKTIRDVFSNSDQVVLLPKRVPSQQYLSVFSASLIYNIYSEVLIINI